MPYILHILTIYTIYLPVVAGLNLNLGFRGILNFSSTVFFGLGAYIALICLITDFSLTHAFIIVGLFSIILALIISKITTHLSSDNLALVLFMLLLVIQNAVINWKSLTSGSFGLSVYSLPHKSDELNWLIQNLSWLSMVYSIAVLVQFTIISKSKFGLWWLSSRDNLKLSKSLGQKWELTRSLNLVLSSIFTAFSGVFYVLYVGYIDPSLFGLNILVLIISMAVLGGLESWKGTVIGTLLLTVLPELLRFLPITSSEIAPLRNIIHGIILLICLIYKPYGLFGRFKVG